MTGGPPLLWLVRRSGAALVLLVRLRASAWRASRRNRRRLWHEANALRHLEAVAAELDHQDALCARYGRGRFEYRAPRVASGVPAIRQG